MTDLHVLVLAAGKGTRMKSAQPKVLHGVGGATLLDRVLETASRLNPASVTIVVGHQADLIEAACAGRTGVSCVRQEPQLGTAHAVLQAAPLLGDRTGTLVLLSGDVPLLSTDTVARLVDTHRRAGAAATVLTASVPRPTGYGRIVKQDGHILRIVEEKDASAEERAIQEINSGVYAFDLAPLFPALRSIATNNAQGEYYLTDLVSIYRRRELVVETVTVADVREIQGVNSRAELAAVGEVVRQQKNDQLMAAGVTLVDPATTYVEDTVVVGPDTVLHPNVYLEGRTVLGAGCVVHAGSRIVDSTLGDRVVVKNYTIVTSSVLHADVQIGPFAHVRPDSEVGEGAHIGNFVELKKTVMGEGTKAGHLAYLGDARIGAGVNIGAGTITCNYDGTRKHQTVIEDGAFIGSDSQLVAPVTVGKGAYVAAGSSIVGDVPAGALGIARARQVNIQGWVDRKKD